MVLGAAALPSSANSKHSSRSSEEVEARLREAAARHKFGILHVHDLRQTLQSKGTELGSECKVYDVCNPQAASQALHADMRVSSVLPCRISIFSEGGGCTIATVEPPALLKVGHEKLLHSRILALLCFREDGSPDYVLLDSKNEVEHKS